MSALEIVRFFWACPPVGGLECVRAGTELLLSPVDPEAWPVEAEYEPLIVEPGMFRRLAGLDPQDDRAIVAAANEVGFLTCGGPVEPLEVWREAIEHLKSACLLDNVFGGLVPREREAAAEILAEHVTDRLEAHTYPVLQGGGKGFGLGLAPRSLLGLLWLQVVREALHEAEFRRCANEECQRWLEYSDGPGASRPNKFYCSYRCNGRANYLRKLRRLASNFA